MISFRGRREALKRRAKQSNQRARVRNRRADLTAGQIRQCIEFWGHCCAFCGQEADLLEDLTIDHWQPLARAKSTGSTVTNILPCCECCNQDKRAKDPVGWLFTTFSPAYAQATLALIQRYFEQIGQ